MPMKKKALMAAMFTAAFLATAVTIPLISMVVGKEFDAPYGGRSNVTTSAVITFSAINGSVLPNSGNRTLEFTAYIESPENLQTLPSPSLYTVSYKASWLSKPVVVYKYSINQPGNLSDDDPNPKGRIDYTLNLTGWPIGPQSIEVTAVGGGYITDFRTFQTFSGTGKSLLYFTIVNELPNPGASSIVVPDDYPDIQTAINNAKDGDTVFVKTGVYRTYSIDGIYLNKSISLIGENSQYTVLTRYPVEYSRFAHVSVSMQAENATISGFTITGSSIGILLSGSGCKITGNNISYGSGDGIYMSSSGKNIVISENNITGNQKGIYQQSSDSLIINNNITQNDQGILVDFCGNVTFAQNNIVGNTKGLTLLWTGPFYVYENNITDNTAYGIEFAETCNNATVHNNNILRNKIGISLYNYDFDDKASIGVGNTVYNNNIAENLQNVLVEASYRYENVSLSYRGALNGTDVVLWDNGYVGNYWSHYQTRYPNASKIDNSGVWDTPYVIDANNTDHYPLTKQVDITAPPPTPNPTPSPTIPELPSWIILPLAMMTVLLAVLEMKRRRKIMTNR